MDCQPLNPEILESAMLDAGMRLLDCDSYPAACPECVKHTATILLRGVMAGGCTESRDIITDIMRMSFPSFTTDPEAN